jgi:tRNA(Ile)-lysidine synthase
VSGDEVREAVRVREVVRAGGLLAADRPLVAMLSGGRDSVCLLDVALTLCDPGDVQALHVNYGLREQADADEHHCVALCERLGVTLSVVRERSPSGNLQAWAREVRYRAAERLALPNDALIATGHTASDQVETILYRLAASPGRRALLGMTARERRLIRPLLSVTREQTRAYCEARGLGWREDESNEDVQYARVRVRRALLAALRTVHPAAEANVLRTAALLREETELLDGLVQAELAGGDRIALVRLAKLPTALARLVVVRLAEDAAGTYVPQAGTRVREIIALGARGGRAELHVGGQVGAVIDAGTLRMIKLPARVGRQAGGRARTATEPPPGREEPPPGREEPPPRED